MLLLLVLLASVVPRVVAFRGISRTAALSFFDTVGHLSNATKLARLHSHGRAHTVDRELINESRWPPGVYHISRLWIGPLGPLSLWTTQLTNLLFGVILLAAVAGLGARLFSVRAGLWGALLCALCPGLAAASWYYSQDFPLAAMVLVGLFLLHRSRGFSRWGETLLFGLWSALGLWIKFNYAIYLGPPALVVLVLGLLRGPARHMPLLRVACGAALAAATALLLGLPLGTLWSTFMTHLWASNPDALMYPEGLKPLGFKWAVANLAFSAMAFPLPLLVLTVPALVMLHQRSQRARLAMVLAFLWGNYLILTLMAVKMERYMLPLYPVLCLLTAWWATSLQSRAWRRAALAAVTALYCVVLVMTHRQSPLDGSLWYRDAALSGLHEMQLPSSEALAQLRAGTFRDTDCELEPLMRQVVALSRAGGASTSPLALFGLEGVMLGDEPVTPRMLGQIILEANHRRVDRFFYPGDPWTNKAERRFLMINPPGWDRFPRDQLGQVVATRSLTLRCGRGDLPLLLLLLHRSASRGE